VPSCHRLVAAAAQDHPNENHCCSANHLSESSDPSTPIKTVIPRASKSHLKALSCRYINWSIPYQ
jgi:hypothetical protein